MRNKAGVIDMCLEEFDFEKYKQLVAEDMAELKAALADKDAALADKDAEIAGKDAALADKDAEIAKLKKLLAERNS